MKYKSIITTLLFVFIILSTTIHAKVRITTESLDKAVNNIESTYKAVYDMTTDFEQKSYVVILNKNVLNIGVMKWKKPGKFFIDYTGSDPKQYISNGKKIWIYVPGDTQVEVYKVSNETISKETLEFMRGFVNIKKFFNITGWKKQKSMVELKLMPIFEGAPYSRLTCKFGSNNLLKEVTIHNITGNISTYKFNNVRINNDLPDTIFTFKKPKGVKEVRSY